MAVVGRKAVLVVDDDPELQELLAEALIDAGYDALRAPDGTAAVRLARTTRLDLILLDLMLPWKTGHEVLADLDTNPLTCAIPVVVVSAFTDGLQSRAQVRAVVRKPFDVWQLLHLIAQLIGPA